MNNDQSKRDLPIHNSPPDVGSIISSRLALPNSEPHSDLSDYTTDYSWQGLLLIEDDYKKLKLSKPVEEAHPSQRLRVESLLGSCSHTTPIIQPELPPSVAGPSSEHTSPVTIVEHTGTASKRQKADEPLKNTIFIPHREPVFELSHLVEQGRTAAKPLRPIAPRAIKRYEAHKNTTFIPHREPLFERSHLVKQGRTVAKPLRPMAPRTIKRYEVHNSTMKKLIVVSFKDTTTILNDKGFGSAKQPNDGHWCKYCSKFMKDKKDLRIHILTHHMKEKIFKCSICENGYTKKNNLKQHMRRVHNIANK